MYLTKQQKDYITTLTMPLYRIRPVMRLIPFSLFMRDNIKQKVFKYSVRNREDLLRLIDNRLPNLFSKSFYTLLRSMATYDQKERDKVCLSISEKEKALQARTANFYLKRLAPKAEEAFYLCNKIYYCRLGCAVKMIEKEEAYEIMLESAKKLQKNYSSWQEYLTAYFEGYISNNSRNMSRSYIYKKYGNIAAWFFTRRMPDWETEL